MTKKKKIILIAVCAAFALILLICAATAAAVFFSQQEEGIMFIDYAYYYEPKELIEKADFIGIIRIEEAARIKDSYTHFRAAVVESVKGTADEEITYASAGYRTRFKVMTASNDPLPTKGQTYLIFANKGDGVYYSINGGNQGRYDIDMARITSCYDAIAKKLCLSEDDVRSYLADSSLKQ